MTHELVFTRRVGSKHQGLDHSCIVKVDLVEGDHLGHLGRTVDLCQLLHFLIEDKMGSGGLIFELEAEKLLVRCLPLQHLDRCLVQNQVVRDALYLDCGRVVCDIFICLRAYFPRIISNSSSVFGTQVLSTVHGGQLVLRVVLSLKLTKFGNVCVGLIVCTHFLFFSSYD